jgi:hypothetical protein
MDVREGNEMDTAASFPGSFQLHAAAQAARKAWDEMITRTTTDPAFRVQLLEDPIVTMRAAGIAVPEGIAVTVIEFDPKHAYFFLPPPVAPAE